MNRGLLSSIFLVALPLVGMTHDEWVFSWLHHFDQQKYHSVDVFNGVIKQNAAYKSNYGNPLYSPGYAILFQELPNYWESLEDEDRVALLVGLLQQAPSYFYHNINANALNAIYSAWSGEESRVCMLRLHEKMLEYAQQESPSIYTTKACKQVFEGFCKQLENRDFSLEYLLGVCDIPKQLAGVELADRWFAIAELVDGYRCVYYKDKWQDSLLLKRALVDCANGIAASCLNAPSKRDNRMDLLMRLADFYRKYDYDLSLIKSVPQDHIKELLAIAFEHAIKVPSTLEPLVRYAVKVPCVIEPLLFDGDVPVRIPEGITMTATHSRFDPAFVGGSSGLPRALRTHWKAALWYFNRTALKNLRYLAPLAQSAPFKAFWSNNISHWVPFEDVAAGKNIHYVAARNWCGYHKKSLAVVGLVAFAGGYAARHFGLRSYLSALCTV